MTHAPGLLRVRDQSELDKALKSVMLEDDAGEFVIAASEGYGARIAALWNMAERLGLATEEIEGIASDTNLEATVECFLGCPKPNDLMKKYMRKQYGRTR
jgi:hypothetical protein